MSALKGLLPEDIELLASLPYRVGLWMSHVDDEEGEADDEKEMAALNRIIETVARLDETSSVVKEICTITLEHKARWPEWTGPSRYVLPDCEKSIRLLTPYLNEHDLKDFRHRLLQIARAVAEAHGEFGEFDAGFDDDEGAGMFSRFLTKITDKFQAEDDSDDESKFMNVSAVEQAAMKRLSQALTIEKGS